MQKTFAKQKFGKSNLENFLHETGRRGIENLTKREAGYLQTFSTLEQARKRIAKIGKEEKYGIYGKRYTITAESALISKEDLDYASVSDLD